MLPSYVELFPFDFRSPLLLAIVCSLVLSQGLHSQGSFVSRASLTPGVEVASQTKLLTAPEEGIHSRTP